MRRIFKIKTLQSSNSLCEYSCINDAWDECNNIDWMIWLCERTRSNLLLMLADNFINHINRHNNDFNMCIPYTSFNIFATNTSYATHSSYVIYIAYACSNSCQTEYKWQCDKVRELVKI